MYKELTTWLTMQTLFSSQHNQLRCWISCCATPKGVSRQIIYLLFFPCFSTEMTSSEPDLNFHFELIRYTTVFFSLLDVNLKILKYTVMTTTALMLNNFTLTDFSKEMLTDKVTREQVNAHFSGSLEIT